jgi:hypothetical protein
MYKKKILLYLFIFYWIFLWASINVAPDKIYFFGESYIKSIDAARIALAILTSILISIYFLYIFASEKVKINKINFFFFLFFLSHVVGLFFNKERSFDINNLYLAILSIGTVCLIVLCNHYKIKNIMKYFIYISVLFLTFALILTLLGKFNELKNLNFYEIYAEHDVNFLGHANPRITGTSRMLAIINLFLILYYFKSKNFYLKKFLLYFLLFCATLLLFMQSRGSLICYFVSTIVIILFLINGKNSFRIKYFLILIAFPFLLYFFISNFFLNNKSTMKKDVEISNRILTTTTSGRYEVWHHTIKNYKYKNFFGYGPNGDRFFLKSFDKKDKYGDNTSNIWLHSLVSGGFASIFFLILIFLGVVKIFKNNKKRIFSYNNSVCFNFSIVCLVFFFIRSFFENSFGLFSIDFLITYLSISYLIISTQKIKK